MKPTSDSSTTARASTAAGSPQRNRLEFSWLMKLRFAEIAGQTATILGAHWLLADTACAAE